jgi:putative DNA methylase
MSEPLPYKKKLIEVSIPLEAINKESAREKSIRHGHPSTLHLWWARRPLATARAVLFSQLVDDPSAHPELFPTEEEQDAERARLHRMIEELVKWENINNEPLFAAATEEIRKSNNGELPAVLDPFAGGGTIPLEAQRLGLEAHASDLNPVAVLINKAMIEIPPKFAGMPPVHPEAEKRTHWKKAEGLAEDIRKYGKWLRDEAFKQVGHLYPKAVDENGKEHTVIAWIWARTVKSPNPANPIETPLVRSWWLSKKKGREAWVRATIVDGAVRYEVQHNNSGPKGTEDGTVTRTGAKAVGDGTPIDFEYIREESRQGRMGAHLIAIVCEGDKGRLYLHPNSEQAIVADLPKPDDAPTESLPEQALGFRVQNYGFKRWADLFTNRQLTTLLAICSLVDVIRSRVLEDAHAAGTFRERERERERERRRAA